MNEKIKLAIVVIAYNRPHSLERVLNSLNYIQTNGNNIPLIISIDKSDTDKVLQVAKKFNWDKGNKRIIAHKENQGLKKHILNSGNLLREFDALAVLEDDTFITPNLYNYMKEAVEHYKNDKNIAGISLYNHLWQIESDRPFLPMRNQYDTYFLQYAQSWGQIWLKDQWFDFLEWYKDNQEFSTEDNTIPENVVNWPDTSWLKHHIRYCISENKYFVYPYDSLSTNFTDEGTHNFSKSTRYQVPMMYGIKKNYNFADLKSQDSVIYDAFFERKKLGNYLKLKESQLEVDLYRTKRKYTKSYVLTSKNLNYKIVSTYGLELRPMEMNIIYNIPGDSIKLYDLRYTEENPRNDYNFSEWLYDTKNRNIKGMFKYINFKVINKISNLFK